MIEELEAKMEAERAANADELKRKEEEMRKLMENADGDEEMKKRLIAEIEASKK